MKDCLICGAPPDPQVGYSMGIGVGWVCSNTCRNEYNSHVETVSKDSEPVKEKTYIQKAVEIIMNKANEHRTEAGELDKESKECIFRAAELEGIAKEISMLGTEDEL